MLKRREPLEPIEIIDRCLDETFTQSEEFFYSLDLPAYKLCSIWRI